MKNIAKRVQLPLKVAYAMTIHKSQGMSLEGVVVNCDNCSRPGQIGVAVGRAKSIDGLRVRNFKSSMCKIKKHPSSVVDFYKNASIGDLKDDLACCRTCQIHSQETNEHEDDIHELSVDPGLSLDLDSDFSDNEMEKLEFRDTFTMECISPADEYALSRTAFDHTAAEFLDTPMEETISTFQCAECNVGNKLAKTVQ